MPRAFSSWSAGYGRRRSRRWGRGQSASELLAARGFRGCAMPADVATEIRRGDGWRRRATRRAPAAAPAEAPPGAAWGAIEKSFRVLFKCGRQAPSIQPNKFDLPSSRSQQRQSAMTPELLTCLFPVMKHPMGLSATRLLEPRAKHRTSGRDPPTRFHRCALSPPAAGKVRSSWVPCARNTRRSAKPEAGLADRQPRSGIEERAPGRASPAPSLALARRA